MVRTSRAVVASVRSSMSGGTSVMCVSMPSRTWPMMPWQDGDERLARGVGW